MKFLNCILMLIFVIFYDALEFSVRGSRPLVVDLGGSVLLPCSVDSLVSVEKVKVEWRKTDSEIVVHLYHDGDIRPEAQHEDYRDRAHFFTDDIKHGNFSLLLTNVRQEDKGVYRCKVYSEQGAEKTLVEIKDVEYLIVSGSDQSLSVYVGEDVTLNCSVDSHIPSEHIEEVSWKKRVQDEHITVLLYQNNEVYPDASDERYRDRVEFFSDEIHRGNFSLRLKRVRPEDKGLYMCHVFAGRFSDNTTVILGSSGLSGLHIVVLILCISACGSALLLCSLICRSNNTGRRLLLHVHLYFCPNILILLAFVLWGTTEASLNEMISCGVVCVLRPLRLLWVTPYINDFPGVIKKNIESSHADLYFPAVLGTMYSALLAEHFRGVNTVSMMVICALLVLVCLLFIIQLAKRFEKLLSGFGRLCKQMYEKVGKRVAACGFFVLPSIELSVLLYPFVGYWTVFFAVALPVLACLSLLCRCCKNAREAQQYFSLYLDKAVWTLMSALSGILVWVYIAVLRNEKKEYVGLVCMGGFLQVLWMLIFSEIPVNYSKRWIRSIMFQFGAVGLILVFSVALMVEVILVAVNGERLMGDLRIGVFPFESLFTIPLLILPIFTHRTPVNTTSHQGSQNSVEADAFPTTKSTGLDQNQTGESHEMETLRKDAENSVAIEEIT
ncbi:uncharacterized protein LOC130561507 [Triplophysa rosa]|uniref:Ig-like domain-containing protein n=1 Tax=Triplophysa rosa TaxID=992332 RepID=A0A9W7WM96_TRIRA|nr:uncharacterized protein LOC130561507 [Triplophysa rosa]KAI7803538.1 hypothetical protein IRJ41_008048 [Triplophysa rosa]